MRFPTVPLLAALGLAACALSPYQGEFQCKIPASAGGCRPLQDVYTQTVVAPPLPAPPDLTRLAPSPATTPWTPPVKTVWMAPYVDTAGRRHEASILRLIIFPGLKAVNAEPEFLIPPIPETTEGGGLIAPPAGPPSAPTGVPPGHSGPRGAGTSKLPSGAFSPPPPLLGPGGGTGGFTPPGY